MNLDYEFEEVEREDYIEIKHGHDCGACFWIMPVKYNPKAKPHAVLKEFAQWKQFRKHEISIDEIHVGSYLSYFLLKYFNPHSFANETRYLEPDDEGTFVWFLEHNFFEYSEIEKIIADIKILIQIIYEAVSRKDCIEKINKQYPPIENASNIAKEICDALFYSVNAAVDFYNRFCDAMENMMKNCAECNVITFIAP